MALPPPPNVPPDGLAVGNAPDGPSAVSALRFELDPGEVPVSLKLTVHERLAPGASPVVACLATSAWFASRAGNWGERPKAACPAGVRPGAASADGGAVSFDLGSLPATAGLDLMILPEPGSTTPFQVSFKAPQAGSLTTRTDSSGVTGFGGGTSGAPEFGGEGFDDDGFGGGFGGAATGETDTPLSFGDQIPAAPSDTGSTGRPAPASPTVGGFRPLAAPGTPPEPSDPRPLALVILAAAAAAMVMLRREALPPPRLLGPMAGRETAPPPKVEAPGGLGRFRRDRSGTPPSLT